MDNPLSYYKQHLETYKVEANKLYKRMTSLSFFRVIVFLATAFGVYLSFNFWQIAVLILMIGIGIFVFLLSKYTDIKALHDFNKALVEINAEEIKIASGDFHHRNEGLQFQDPNHFYSLDIDLFGRGSFFQFINRATINEGTQKLADALLANATDAIELRQDAIKELSSKAKWWQHYSATSSLVEVETPAKDIIKWLQNYKPFLPKTIQWLPLAFSLITLILIGLVAFNFEESDKINSNSSTFF